MIHTEDKPTTNINNRMNPTKTILIIENMKILHLIQLNIDEEHS